MRPMYLTSHYNIGAKVNKHLTQTWRERQEHKEKEKRHISHGCYAYKYCLNSELEAQTNVIREQWWRERDAKVYVECVYV